MAAATIITKTITTSITAAITTTITTAITAKTTTQARSLPMPNFHTRVPETKYSSLNRRMHPPKMQFPDPSTFRTVIGLTTAPAAVATTTASPSLAVGSGFLPENALPDLPPLPGWIIWPTVVLCLCGVAAAIQIYFINAPPQRANTLDFDFNFSFANILDYVKRWARRRKNRSRDEEAYELLYSTRLHGYSEGDGIGATTAMDIATPDSATVFTLTPRLGGAWLPDEATWIRERAAFDEEAQAPQTDRIRAPLLGNGGGDATSRGRSDSTKKYGYIHKRSWLARIEGWTDAFARAVVRLYDDDGGEDGLLFPIEEEERMRKLQGLDSVI